MSTSIGKTLEDAIGTVEKDVFNSFQAVKGLLMHADAVALKAMNIAKEDLPVVAEGLAAAASVLSIAVPGAGGVAALLATAATVVTNADKYVVTADGVLMDPAEAVNIGAQLSATPPTDDQKRTNAVEMVKRLHPMKAGLANNAAHLAVQLAVAKQHHVEPARNQSVGAH